jgi:hypothetical protein
MWNAHANAYGQPFGNAHSHSHVHAYTDGHSHVYTDPDGHSYSYAYTHGNVYAYRDCYGDVYAYRDSYGHVYAYRDSNGDSDSDSYTYANLRSRRVAIGSAPASGPLYHPGRPRHGQQALHRRRPDCRPRADRLRPGLAL